MLLLSVLHVALMLWSDIHGDGYFVARLWLQEPDFLHVLESADVDVSNKFDLFDVLDADSWHEPLRFLDSLLSQPRRKVARNLDVADHLCSSSHPGIRAMCVLEGLEVSPKMPKVSQIDSEEEMRAFAVCHSPLSRKSFCHLRTWAAD